MDAGEPGRHDRRAPGEPLDRKVRGSHLVAQDAVHPLVFELDRELEVREQPGNVGTFLLVALAHQRADRGRAKIRAKGRVATREVAHVEMRVHRMRGPRQEHDGPPGPVGPFDLCEHALLARLDQLEATEAELVLLDQVEDVAVAVVTGLDAINRCPKLFSESMDIREVLQARVVQIVRHGKRVLRADEVVPDDFDGAVVGVGLHHRFLRRASSCRGRRRCRRSSSTPA